MKSKLPIFAILVVSSQLALADAANDPVFDAASAPVDGSDQAMGESTDPQLPQLPIGFDLAESLQSKLDEQMQFDQEQRDPSGPEFAGTN